MPESLEQLDLLLMQEARARKVRRDGIHFQSFRYLSLTLAAYVGEESSAKPETRRPTTNNSSPYRHGGLIRNVPGLTTKDGHSVKIRARRHDDMVVTEPDV